MTINTSYTLPYSPQILDTKIKKKKHHIEHLTSALGHRKTHGGKNYRAKQISLKEQIQTASKELEVLKQAKKTNNVKTTPINKLVASLNNEDFQMIGEHIGQIFKSTVDLPEPKVTISSFYNNEDQKISKIYHSHPPIFYHNYISLILANDIRKELQTKTTTREYFHSLFLFKIRNNGDLFLFDEIIDHVPLDFKIKLEIDPNKNAQAKDKKDLIFTAIVTRNDEVATESFSLKDLVHHFPTMM